MTTHNNDSYSVWEARRYEEKAEKIRRELAPRIRLMLEKDVIRGLAK